LFAAGAFLFLQEIEDAGLVGVEIETKRTPNTFVYPFIVGYDYEPFPSLSSLRLETRNFVVAVIDPLPI